MDNKGEHQICLRYRSRGVPSQKERFDWWRCRSRSHRVINHLDLWSYCHLVLLFEPSPCNSVHDAQFSCHNSRVPLDLFSYAWFLLRWLLTGHWPHQFQVLFVLSVLCVHVSPRFPSLFYSHLMATNYSIVSCKASVKESRFASTTSDCL
jgi:hypothetical protein